MITPMMLKALLDRASVVDPAQSARLFEAHDPAEPDLAARAALTTHVASDPAASRWAQRVRASPAQLARATAEAAVDTVTAVLASGRDLSVDVLHRLDTSLAAARKSPAITNTDDVRALHAVVRSRRRRADIASVLDEILANTDAIDGDPAPLAAALAADPSLRTTVLCAIGDRLMLDHAPIGTWAAAAAAGRLGTLNPAAESDARAAWTATVLAQPALRAAWTVWTSSRTPEPGTAELLARVAAPLNLALQRRIASRISAGATVDAMPGVAASVREWLV
ncbi:hypothetical protein AMAG_11256 [Allomyces macrogynus ATCC 38327]|uniref:DUF2336 domain-containing protein n=1 Tax=Allomyces macrogynus (strain ATCC 38327) TaxID=578462 RepID=A0A0L0SWB3_ALLM3|nr:hypothetical protein AMAG_11256 [Allomyces macrogynus ATCC 38327]|eukprot:KNE66761.1 hypothetical protein AMAG_11256 [Allomyces macrogynus ATCC 38327]